MAYTFDKKCAKNLCKQTVLVQLISENVVTFFQNTVYISWVTKITSTHSILHHSLHE